MDQRLKGEFHYENSKTKQTEKVMLAGLLIIMYFNQVVYPINIYLYTKTNVFCKLIRHRSGLEYIRPLSF